MKRAIYSVPGLILLILMAASLGLAQTTYEDPQGRLAIDLPEGWIRKPFPPIFANDPTVNFQDKKNRHSFTIAFGPGIDDPDNLFRQAASQLQSLEFVFDGDILEMTVNGHPARWGILKTPLDPGMIMQCGSVILEDNGIYLIHILRVDVMDSIGKQVERTFQSIRLPGEAVTGVGDVKAVAPPSLKPPWKSDLVGLTLPPGWEEKPKPKGFEGVEGWFENYDLPGSMSVVCFRATGLNMDTVVDGGIKAVTVPNPGWKPVEDQEMQLPNGKIRFVVLRGPDAAKGQETEVVSVLTVSKTEKCYVLLYLTGSSSLLADLKAHALEITKTVK
jgi:hypothetical protein